MRCLYGGYGDAASHPLRLYDEETLLSSFEIDSPSFVIAEGGRMFCVTESDTHAEIHSFTKAGMRFLKIDTAHFPATALCHLAYCEKNRTVYGACWGSGDLLCATIDAEGRFIRTTLLHPSAGNPEETGRVHFCHVSPDGRTLTVNNLGLDTIYFYDITGTEPREIRRLFVGAGKGPRHGVYSPDGSLYYVITELSNEILAYDAESGVCRQCLSTLPDGFSGRSAASAICLSKNNAYLYAANRFSDTIAVFCVGADGTLSHPRFVPCHGKTPRHMELSRDGKRLIVAYQASNLIEHLSLTDDGLPAETLLRLELPCAAAICEV